jgi:glycosyltransferase involved in cell wall biosynthesis
MALFKKMSETLMPKAHINCLYLLDSPLYDKYEHYYILKGLIESGFNPLIGYFYGDSNDSTMTGNGIYAVSLGLTKKQFRHFNPFTVLKLHNLIKRNHISVVHCHRYKPLVNAALAITGTDVSKLLYTIGGMGVLRNAHRRAIFNRICKKIDRIICISNSVKNDMLYNSKSLDPSKLTVIFNGIDANVYNIAMGQQEAREILNLPQKGFLFGIVARLKKAKAHNILLHAFAKVAGTDTNVFLIIVGGGPLEEELKREVDELDIASRVFFLGYKKPEEVPVVLRALDCFVHPSRREGLGMAILEAMSAGLPVIATETDGIIDIFNTPETIGAKVSANDASALAESMNNFLKMERSELKLIGKKARCHVAENFSRERMVEKTVSMYIK